MFGHFMKNTDNLPLCNLFDIFDISLILEKHGWGTIILDIFLQV